MKVVKRIELTAVPFARWDDELHQHVNATGFEVEFEDGERCIEYEDSNFEYASDFIKTTERDEHQEELNNSGITVVEATYLKDMPFDRWDESLHQHVHATGRYVTLSTGESYTEYEDEVYPDAPDCKYTYEEPDHYGYVDQDFPDPGEDPTPNLPAIPF